MIISWFDVEKKLEVQIEDHGGTVTSQPDKTFTYVKDQFNYNPDLPADKFIPGIPEGYINARPGEIKAARSKKFLRNIQIFAENRHLFGLDIDKINNCGDKMVP